MTDIYNKIAQLSPEKRRLLEQKLQQKKFLSQSLTITPIKNKPAEIPLSSAQLRMWLLDRFEPGNPAYNRPTYLKLYGEINVKILQQSLNKIIERHEILRTSFPLSSNGFPRQKIGDRFVIELPVIDLSNLSEIEQDRIKELAITTAKHTFDLSKFPLIKASLLSLKQNEHILLLNFHHIIFDGWSAEIFTTELKTIYSALVKGKSLSISPLPIQYADFSIWQQQQQIKGVFDEQLAYWKQQLKGELPVLNLPKDRPRKVEQTFNGRKVEIILNAEITQSLKDLSVRENATLYMTLLAAFKILLYEYTDRKDIIIGSPIAGRNRTETESLIGIFINTLAIRTQINPDLTFKQFLTQVKQTVLDAQSNKDIPFDKIVEALDIKRNLSYSSVFQVLFQLKNVPQSESINNSITVENLNLDLEIAILDLTLEIEIGDNNLRCLFKYNKDLFDLETIQTISKLYKTILDRVLLNPDITVNRLASVCSEEKVILQNNKAAKYIDNSYIIEQQLIQIVRDVLAIDNINIEDNLLELGINSLSAMRLVSRIFQQMQIEIKLNTMFQYPTIIELSKKIYELQKDTQQDITNSNSSLSIRKDYKKHSCYFKCCLIGEQTFVHECANILLQKGHKITGIISTGDFISNWANSHNIPFIEPTENLFSFLQKQSFDYLFSVYNLKILAPEVITLANKRTINCHDALLPQYGGINATSWAILNQEKTHGITWHIVNDKIDEGDILLQKKINISSDETAFTLNNKCYQEILSSFSELINNLAIDKLTPIPQNLDNKSYYFASQKPSIGCLLSFNQSAKKIDAFIRSLDFGIYPNYIGLPKIAINEDFIVVFNVAILALSSSITPGTIVAIQSNCIQVSTTTNDIAITEVKSITGEPISIDRLVNLYSLTVGYQFKQLSSDLLDKIHNIEKKSFVKEQFWLQKIDRFKPVSIPFKNYSFRERKVEHFTWNVSYRLAKFIKENNVNKCECLTTIFSFFFAYSNAQTSVNIGYKNYWLQNQIKGLENIYTSIVPLAINFNLDFNFKETLIYTKQEIETLEKNKTYSKDIFIRHSIKNVPEFSIIIERVAKLTNYKIQPFVGFTFTVSEADDYCYVVYDRQQLDDKAILEFSHNLTIFAEKLISNSAIPLSKIFTFNNTTSVLDKQIKQQPKAKSENCIHQLVETQAVKTPNAIAIRHENKFITYQELNYRANQLARYLQQKGVKKESIVAIYLPKSIALIISLLATLKSGAAYLPLDTKYPPNRLNYIIEDARITALITNEDNSLWTNTNINIVYIETLKKQLYKNSTENLDLLIQPHNLAYVIYTSGSTGKPKGVAIEHHSLVSFVNSAIAKYNITHSDTILQFASIGFDTAVEEIYPCLATGATLVLRSEEMIGSTAKFLEYCHNCKITVLDLPTAYWHQIAEDITTANISLSPFLRLVIIGGEKALSSKVALWQQYTGGYPELVNTYGPTEATVVTTAYKITADIDVDIPIGKPIAHTECYILNSNLQPLPPGVPGELYIGGAGIARGYLHRPELTAEKFINKSFEGKIIKRLYKTGDKALLLADGNIQFLGRIDNQVKIRGFRVELGEIEAVLRNYSLIRDAIVTSIEVNPGNLKLAAYFISTQNKEINLTEIRNYLINKLPEYAIPAALIPLETFPLTVNGKIDKKSLPTPQWQTKPTNVNYNSPATAIETELIKIWQTVLQQETIGIEDDFFAIGGHSLLAVQVSNQIAQKLQVDISLKQIFAYPTIRQLSQEIAKLTNNNTNTITFNTSVENQLIKIWQTVLQQETIGIEDDFFAIGGHSLLAVQVSNQIAQKLQVDISLKQIFAYPTIRQLSQEIAKLTNNNTNTITPTPSFNPSITEKIPLSFAQTRLWFLEQLEPGKTTYTIPFAFSIVGTLNIAALKASLNEVVKRHEVLRTSFITVEGKPQQIIKPYAAIDIPVVDLSQYPEAQTQAKNIVDTVARESFDLTTAPMLKAKLICLNKDEHWLIINIHHIAFDGWSRNIFNCEISALYSAYCNNQPSPLAPLTTQYADYAKWQRQYLQQDRVKLQLNYWSNKLAGLPRLQLPIDYPRPQHISDKGSRETFNLNSQLTARLKQLSQQQKSTLFMTMLTAFKVFLYRYTSQTDILVGTPMAERDRLQTADLIGFLVNTLVLRSQINPDASFVSLLAQVKETALAAYENKDIPFDKLVEKLATQRDSRYTPLFDVCFVMQDTSKNLELENLLVTPLKIKREVAKFDLSLSLQETATGIDGAIYYRTDLFKATTIARMVNHFQTLLESIIAQPDKAIYQLPLLTASERQKLLKDWNNTQTDYPQKPINQLWETQVAKTPDTVALVYKEQQLTYQQLNSKANQLARYLQILGIQPTDTVGICLERSFETIVALIAILKVGGVYLPLDTAYPQERLYFMLSDSNPSVLLTHTSLYNKFDRYSQQKVCLDRDWNKIDRLPDKNLEIKVQPEDLAYIMYTSGSTGKPKGVCIKHKGVVRLVNNTNYASLDSQQVFLQLAPISFDAATLEIWGSLLNGAKLILYPEPNVELEKLKQIIHQHQITILWLTTALFNLIIDEDITALKPVRQLLTGGDVSSTTHVQKVLSTLNNCQLINCYGPTENTTFSTYYPINELPKSCTSIPIGKPIANTQAYILDSRLQPVPVGVVGELYVAGDGLAMGYLNRPQLTAERFIDSDTYEVRGIGNNNILYKTGDRAKYLEDGNIEFIGRIDNQVKIRGYRIELGEIEAALIEHPQIKDAIVLAKKTTPGDKNLEAYLVAKENLTSQELRQFLRDKLPLYMIPNSYLFLKKFPLSPNGKINRQALLNLQKDTSATQHTSPRDEIETKLAQIWQELLDLPSVSVTDDFFAIGGNSLLSIALIAAVEKTFQQKIPVNTFFRLSTIEQLASIISQQQQITKPTTFVPNFDPLYRLTEREYSMLLASTVPEKRVLSDRLITVENLGNPAVRKPLFFVYLLGDLAQHLPSDLPLYKLNIATTVIERPETYIKALATHYVQEIRKIQPQGEYYIGGYCVGGQIALEIARQLKAQKQEVANLILVETATFNPVYLHYQSLISELGYRVWLKFLTRTENLQGASLTEKMTLLKEILLKLPAKIRRKIAPQLITNYPEPTVEMQIRHTLKLAMRYYRMDAYYGKATLFLAKRSTLHSPIFPLAGWKKFFKREFNSYLINGDHVTINEGENAVLLAEYINKCIG